MGTNYYHKPKPCGECGHDPNQEHIGKSSAGWTFSFHGTNQLRSWKDWRDRLEAGGEIADEYGCTISLEEFVSLVEEKRTAPHNHATYCRRSDDWLTRQHGERDCWLDDEGNSFSGREFS